jgi:uncharacterized OsmC-like protein
MNVVVKHQGNVAFEIQARNHRILCDQPVTNKGGDRGMTPPELMLASLGACAAYYAVEYLRTRGLSEDSVEVQVDAEKAAGPARLGSFTIKVSTNELDERHRQGLMRAVKACLIHNTLLHAPNIEVTLECHGRVLLPA